MTGRRLWFGHFVSKGALSCRHNIFALLGGSRATGPTGANTACGPRHVAGGRT